jgi:nitrite reductase (NADH) small subunit
MRILVCAVSDLADGGMRLVNHGDLEIGVFRQSDEYFAYRNVCPHQGGPACEGVRVPRVRDIIDENGVFLRQDYDRQEMHLVCPWHGYEFRLRDGRHAGDAKIGLTKFEITMKNGEIYVDV